MTVIYIICSSIIFFIAAFIFRKQLVSQLLKLKGKLHIHSLRKAINDADADKEETGRKNMVVFNTTTGEFEPVQKKLLKTAAKVTKNKNNAARTKGRVKFAKPVKKRYITTERVNKTEKNSLYVTN